MMKIILLLKKVDDWLSLKNLQLIISGELKE